MTAILGFLLQTAPRGPTGPHGPVGPNPGPHGPMPGGWPGSGVMPWGAAGNGVGLLPTLLWLLVLVALLAAVAYLGWRLVSDRPSPGAAARDVLERRYARGEIDDEEFERRRDRLLGVTWSDHRPEQ